MPGLFNFLTNALQKKSIVPVIHLAIFMVTVVLLIVVFVVSLMIGKSFDVF